MAMSEMARRGQHEGILKGDELEAYGPAAGRDLSGSGGASPGFSSHSNSARFRPWRSRIRFGFEGAGTGFGSVPVPRGRIRFGSGAQEPDYYPVRFQRPGTGLGSVWPDCISVWRLGCGY